MANAAVPEAAAAVVVLVDGAVAAPLPYRVYCAGAPPHGAGGEGPWGPYGAAGPRGGAPGRVAWVVDHHRYHSNHPRPH